LVITDFTNDGILASNSSGNTFAGNYIGIDVGGINAQNGRGITLTDNSSGNTIGGTSAAAGSHLGERRSRHRPRDRRRGHAGQQRRRRQLHRPEA